MSGCSVVTVHLSEPFQVDPSASYVVAVDSVRRMRMPSLDILMPIVCQFIPRRMTLVNPSASHVATHICVGWIVCTYDWP